MKARPMLTLQFIPHTEIRGLDSDARIEKLLRAVKEEKILLVEGRLRPAEEAGLIRKTMEQIDHSFKGIEISPLYYEKKGDEAFLERLRARLIGLLLGSREGFTVIGPASIVKEIKRDPDKIQLFTEDAGRKRK